MKLQKLPAICMVLGWALSAMSAFAALGDSKAQIEASVHTRLIPGPKSNIGLLFSKDWLTLYVFDANDQCIIVAYYLLPDAYGRKRAIRQETWDRLTQQNCPGVSKWTSTPVQDPAQIAVNARYWMSPDMHWFVINEDVPITAGSKADCILFATPEGIQFAGSNPHLFDPPTVANPPSTTKEPAMKLL